MHVLGLEEAPSGLYEVALTHRSFAFEEGTQEHNERLEFLGDAVVGIVVTDVIFRTYPELTEGDMARLRASVVNTHALAGLARELGLAPLMRLGKGEESSGGRDKDSLLANVFEAVVGALYLEHGIEETRSRLENVFRAPLERAAAAEDRYDAKTALQEVVVRKTTELPVYRVSSTGPDHDRRYAAHVFVAGEQCGTGEGRSKKEAEQNAARAALRALAEGDLDARAS